MMYLATSLGCHGFIKAIVDSSLYFSGIPLKYESLCAETLTPGSYGGIANYDCGLGWLLSTAIKP